MENAGSWALPQDAAFLTLTQQPEKSMKSEPLEPTALVMGSGTMHSAPEPHHRYSHLPCVPLQCHSSLPPRSPLLLCHWGNGHPSSQVQLPFHPPGKPPGLQSAWLLRPSSVCLTAVCVSLYMPNFLHGSGVPQEASSTWNQMQDRKRARQWP